VAAVNIKNTYGQSLFAKIKHLVQPDTILKWFRKLIATHATYNNTPKKPGRPPLSLDCVSAILKYPKEAAPFNKIECEEFLGGLLKHYHVRDAA
ncbi:MAG: hypothetical protein JXB49_34780, partial [Bacteroidales bacterium]|nr:hypothetical protein [Bacteroidales bacterium]